MIIISMIVIINFNRIVIINFNMNVIIIFSMIVIIIIFIYLSPSSNLSIGLKSSSSSYYCHHHNLQYDIVIITFNPPAKFLFCKVSNIQNSNESCRTMLKYVYINEYFLVPFSMILNIIIFLMDMSYHFE